MEFSNRKSVTDKLSKYCYMHSQEDYINITEWDNGEGWDVDIDGKKTIQITTGELEAINYLTKSLDLHDN